MPRHQQHIQLMNGLYLALANVSAADADGQAAEVEVLNSFSLATFMLDITADESTASDTLDVLIQRLLPDESTWDTIVRFNQHLGNAGPAKQVCDVQGGLSDSPRVPDTETDVIGSVTLGAGGVRDVSWGDKLRVAYIITDDSTSASFTFDVYANFRV